jgi:hypothetical protein
LRVAPASRGILSAMTASIRGGCLCGAIRYRVDGPIDHVVICHCAMCRKSVGAQSVTWAATPREAVAIEGDTLRWHASSARGQRGFCSQCGASLFFFDPLEPAFIELTVGTLDEPDRCQPSGHIFVPDKVSWVQLEPGLRQHVKDTRSPQLE